MKRAAFWLLLALFCLLWCVGGVMYADARFKQQCEGMIERQLGYPRATFDALNTLEWPTYGPKE